MSSKSALRSIEWQEASSSRRKWTGVLMQSRNQGWPLGFSGKGSGHGRLYCSKDNWTGLGLCQPEKIIETFWSGWGGQLGREDLVFSSWKNLKALARYVCGKQKKEWGVEEMAEITAFMEDLDGVSQEIGTVRDGCWSTLWKGIVFCCMVQEAKTLPQVRACELEIQRQPLEWEPRFGSSPPTERSHVEQRGQIKVGTVVSISQLGNWGTETMSLSAIDECFAVQMLLLTSKRGFLLPTWPYLGIWLYSQHTQWNQAWNPAHLCLRYSFPLCLSVFSHNLAWQSGCLIPAKNHHPQLAPAGSSCSW